MSEYTLKVEDVYDSWNEYCGKKYIILLNEKVIFETESQIKLLLKLKEIGLLKINLKI